MAITVTLLYDANTREPRPAGDLAVAIYDIVVPGDGANAYPGVAGEPISFAAQFSQVYGVSGTHFGAGFTPWAFDAYKIGYEPDPIVLNTGVLRFFVTGAAPGAALDNLAAGVYPFAFRFRLIVHGRPITDSN